ncbi:sema domain, transmembrane domain (TM), and cytoplasmic domain, (semaphorin) 6C [Stigmatopora nigra]
MRRTPAPALLPLPLALLLAAMAAAASVAPPGGGGVAPFPQDLEPLNVVGRETSYSFPSFQGLTEDNDTERLGLDFQRMLRINHVLYVAARDHVFAINMAASLDRIVPQQKLTWKTKDVDKCTVRGKNSDECYNYVKVLVARDDETLFACGTNAFNPTCRNYKMSTLEQDGEEVVGQARCPFESHQSNVGLFAGGDFYSATMTDFLASDAVIYRSLGESRPVLRTVKYDSKWLREPHFLHAIEYGNFVYFFFREIAVEYTSLGKVVFSRVGRVCKNDNGGSPRVLERYWTSFLKARLNCSVPGDSFFYFDVLRSLTNVLQINRRPAVLGVFTTQANSISGSAVCAFYMDDVEKAFGGKFKEQKNSEAAWTPVPDEQVPEPRPGCCAGEGSATDFRSSAAFPDDTLTFIKSYPLMDEAVPAANNRPLFTRTASRFKLTQIAADTSAGPDRNFTVLFLGSEDGRVLKVLADADNRTLGATLLEDISVYNPDKCNVRGEQREVLGLELDRDHHALFVAFSGCVVRVPLSRCRDYGRCKTHCLSSRDPYCVWLKSGKCVAVTPGLKGAFEQEVEKVASLHSDGCHDVPATTRQHNTPLDTAYGVRRPPEADKSNHSVHYTLLIACVLVAFVLGAFLSGFLVSCYCNRGGRKASRKLPKDPEVQIPHALSLRSLAKLNGLLEGKEERPDTPSTPKIYSSPFSKDTCRGNAHRGVELVLPHHHHLRSSSELSGLPTPDSTPELPIKSMRAFRHQWEKNHNCNNASRPASASSHLLPSYGASCGAERPGYARGEVMEVTSLDELLKHIHEGAGKAARNGRRGGYPTRIRPHVPETETAPYYSSSTLPRDSLTRRMDVPPDPPPSAASERRHSSSQRPYFPGGGGGSVVLPRHHSFSQRSAVSQHALARLNSGVSDGHFPLLPPGYLARYDAARRDVRRGVSLTPEAPPKPLFIPASSPVSPRADFDY